RHSPGSRLLPIFSAIPVSQAPRPHLWGSSLFLSCFLSLFFSFLRLFSTLHCCFNHIEKEELRQSAHCSYFYISCVLCDLLHSFTAFFKEHPISLTKIISVCPLFFVSDPLSLASPSAQPVPSAL